MSTANVYTSVANAVWYTDKCEIVTGGTAVTYNIYQISVTPPLQGQITTGNGNTLAISTIQTVIAANSTITGQYIAANTKVTSQTPGANLQLSVPATGSGNTNVVITAPNPGNIYSAAPQVAANSRQQIYVGAGNYLTITGANFTAREIGTASSAQDGVIGN